MKKPSFFYLTRPSKISIDGYLIKCLASSAARGIYVFTEAQLSQCFALIKRPHITVRRRGEIENAIWHAQRKGMEIILVMSQASDGLSDSDVRHVIRSSFQGKAGYPPDVGGRFVVGYQARNSLYPVEWMSHQRVNLLVLGDQSFDVTSPIPESLAPWPGEVIDGNDVAGAGMVDGVLCLSKKEAR